MRWKSPRYRAIDPSTSPHSRNHTLPTTSWIFTRELSPALSSASAITRARFICRKYSPVELHDFDPLRPIRIITAISRRRFETPETCRFLAEQTCKHSRVPLVSPWNATSSKLFTVEPSKCGNFSVSWDTGESESSRADRRRVGLKCH